MGDAGDWELSKAMARAILHDRGQRRKWLERLLALTVAWMAVGLWVVDGMLSKNALMFVLWWGFCFLLAVSLVLFAFYDVLAVMREEREKSEESFLAFGHRGVGGEVEGGGHGVLEMDGRVDLRSRLHARPATMKGTRRLCSYIFCLPISPWWPQASP